MNGKVAKKLRREAEKLTQGVKPKLTMKVRTIFTGKEDENGRKLYKTLAGTVRHAQGTTREVYQRLKKGENATSS